jgi:hypothetical protein
VIGGSSWLALDIRALVCCVLDRLLQDSKPDPRRDAKSCSHMPDAPPLVVNLALVVWDFPALAERQVQVIMHDCSAKLRRCARVRRE